MRIPINKNKSWIAGLHESIDQLDEDLKLAIMKPAGMRCVEDILSLCEEYLGRPINTNKYHRRSCCRLEYSS